MTENQSVDLDAPRFYGMQSFKKPRVEAANGFSYLRTACVRVFGNVCTCIYRVFVLFVPCFCIVSFMYVYSYLFCLYWCKDCCHRVTTEL